MNKVKEFAILENNHCSQTKQFEKQIESFTTLNVLYMWKREHNVVQQQKFQSFTCFSSFREFECMFLLSKVVSF